MNPPGRSTHLSRKWAPLGSAPFLHLHPPAQQIEPLKLGWVTQKISRSWNAGFSETWVTLVTIKWTPLSFSFSETLVTIFPSKFLESYMDFPFRWWYPPLHVWKSVNYIWLVVYLPLWKIWVRQLRLWNSQYMESHKIHVPNHQPDKFNIAIDFGDLVRG